MDSLTRRPLALSGRVPVKVSIENGPIAIGKALHSGQTIGIALEAYTGPATGPVEVFVASQYWFSPNDFAIDSNTGTIGIGTTTPTNIGGSNYRLAVGGDILATGFVNLSEGDSKADITHISTTTANSFLETVRGLMVAEYHYKNEPASAGRVGLIAEEAPQIVRSTKGNGIDLYKLLSVAIGAIQSLAEKVATIGETIAGFAKSFTTENLSANEVRTEKLCVGDTCVSKEELQALLQLVDAGAGAPVASAPIETETPSDATAGDTVAPTISINGNNPATINVGDSYADLGASVTDNVDQNLGIITLLDGTETVTVNLDTSAPGTHTITYRATDGAGNTASRTRTVIVEAPPSVNAPVTVQPVEDTPVSDPAPDSDGGPTSAPETETTP
ncbi:MAG: hypothetical protein Greene07147_899 [Parcubacteria group bacterium Greene0714_7]|nr:MAG: hypothetical protein Greene07147_899 [Parcubacteria group bacterium Greene0714_7]